MAEKSQVVWQDSQDVERRMELVKQMIAEDKYVPSHENEIKNTAGSKEEEKELKVFLVSGLESLAGLTEGLGRSEIKWSGEYDSSVTHLVISKVTRSEKMICCIAAGKWALHPDYLADSRKVSHNTISMCSNCPNLTKITSHFCNSQLVLQDSAM